MKIHIFLLSTATSDFFNFEEFSDGGSGYLHHYGDNDLDLPHGPMLSVFSDSDGVEEDDEESEMQQKFISLAKEFLARKINEEFDSIFTLPMDVIEWYMDETDNPEIERVFTSDTICASAHYIVLDKCSGITSDYCTRVTDVHKFCKFPIEQRGKVRKLKKLSKGKFQNGKNGLCSTETCTKPWDFGKIWQYGCWCNFDDRLMKGAGKPVDEFDSICQKFQQCLRCSKIDAFHNGTECDAREHDFSPKDKKMTWVHICDNKNSCNKHICSCFTESIQKLNIFSPTEIG